MADRIRVERAVTDTGFGHGWVVLGLTGRIVASSDTWPAAMRAAQTIAKALTS